MQLKHKVHNIKVDFNLHLVRFAYVYAPLIGLIIYVVINQLLEIKLNTDFMSNLINVSGILAGFLFTSLGIIITLPSNQFTSLLKETGYMKIIYNSMIIGIVTLLIAMLVGMFDISDLLAKLFFIIGISETFLSAYYLYKVSYYSGKSK